MGNIVATGFPLQMASIAENVSVLWRHHDNEKIFFRVAMIDTCFTLISMHAGPGAITSASVTYTNQAQP